MTIAVCGTVPASGPLRLTHFCSVTVLAGVWAVQPTTGDKPPPLCGHTFTKIDHRRAVVFGGDTGSLTNDSYVLDTETWVWRCMFPYIVHFNFEICLDENHDLSLLHTTQRDKLIAAG